MHSGDLGVQQARGSRKACLFLSAYPSVGSPKSPLPAGLQAVGWEAPREGCEGHNGYAARFGLGLMVLLARLEALQPSSH